MIADPPASAGAAQLTVACPLPGVALTVVGAPGTGNGVTGSEAFDAGLVPTLLVAVTVNVYGVLLVSVGTMHVSEPLVEQVAPPGDAVTV